MLRPRIKERRRARQIVVCRNHAIKLHRLLHRPRQSAAHAQKELLWSLQRLARLRMAQQIAVIDRPQSEILKQLGPPIIDRIIQLPRILQNKQRGLFRHQSVLLSRRHRLRKRVNILIRDFFRDESVQQPRCKLRVFRLLRNQRSRSLNRQQVQLARSRPMKQAANRLARNANRIDRFQSIRASLDRAHNLVHVGRFEAAVALANLHLRVVCCGRARTWKCCNRVVDACARGSRHLKNLFRQYAREGQ